MNRILRFLEAIFKDERAENDPAGGGNGQGGTPGQSGQGGAPGAEGTGAADDSGGTDEGTGSDQGDDQGGGAGDAGDAGDGDGSGDAGDGQGGGGASGQFGEFGDDPNKVWQAYQALSNEHKGIKTKTTATERNLAAVRSSLKEIGIKVVHDADGNVMLVPEADQKSAPTKKFTDERKKKFASFFDQGKEEHANEFLALLGDFVADNLSDFHAQREQQVTQKTQQQREFATERQRTNGIMKTMFPTILEVDDKGNKNPLFNKAFYDRATELFETKYRRRPDGEWRAASEAAVELKIVPGMIRQATQNGVDAGKKGKIILGAAGSGAQGKGSGTPGKLTREQYLALPADKRAAYDKAGLKI